MSIDIYSYPVTIIYLLGALHSPFFVCLYTQLPESEFETEIDRLDSVNSMGPDAPGMEFDDVDGGILDENQLAMATDEVRNTASKYQHRPKCYV